MHGLETMQDNFIADRKVMSKSAAVCIIYKSDNA